MGLHVHGLHMHTGSDILDIDAFMRGASLLMDLAHDFKELTYIDFGSGFKVGYRPGEATTDIESFGARMSERFKEFCLEYGRDLKLIFEPGKFLVSEAGAFIAKVNSTKTTPSTVFAQVNSGFNHFPRPMMYDAYHHIENLSNPGGEQRLYTIVGYICETDTFGYDRKLNEVRNSDLLAFHNAGAYCSSMASQYNSRVRPAEILIENNTPYLIRERENIEDLVRGTVDHGLYNELPVSEATNEEITVLAGMINIRAAQQQDMKAVLGLITELAIYEKEPDAVIVTEEDLITHGFSEDRFDCFVAEHKDHGVIGMALFYPRYSTWKGPTLHLEDLYVQPEFRQHGVGKQLFDAVVKVAAEQNVGRMEWTVLEWNDPALNFYKKYDASLDPEWHLGTLTREQLAQYK